MDGNATSIETLFERAEDYGKTSIELLKLNAIDKSADVVSSIVSSLIVFTTVAMSFVIINIGVSLLIGKFLDEAAYGFLITGGFYAILSVPLYVFRKKWFKHPVSNSIIRQLMTQKQS